MDKSDDHHEKAREVMDQVRNEDVYISDRVFVETVNVMFSRFDHSDASNFADYMLKSELEIIHSNSSIFSNSVEHFHSEQISFTDCSIVSMMKALDIDKLCSFDSDFKSFEKIELIGVNGS
ncbi:MAG: hypothetical protein BRC28_01520 [Nanohaloarchaea archaeon SW_4_43_9]|nr:MAG: hypothetical protein BRC28_01520 [Nanohaloarchaea archaeon SW_4_43_9]